MGVSTTQPYLVPNETQERFGGTRVRHSGTRTTLPVGGMVLHVGHAIRSAFDNGVQSAYTNHAIALGP